ncbi:MAG: SDR family oxidoreductase [Nitrospinaceae bacterium]|nr:SDR family oxidoreductase [Nitrospina sp.]MBT5870034.1 SDR family oxidoreductase [Nitrospinaceae bacterium]
MPSNAYKQFKDKKVLITGASGGLGHVCAMEFANQGAHLVLAGRDKDKLTTLKRSFPRPEKVMTFAGDLTQAKNIHQLVKEGNEFLGQFDILVHVLGGGYGFRDPLLSWEQLETLHRLNIGAAAEINRMVLPDMIQNKCGYSVHIGSISSMEATASVGYNTVKASLAAYVRSLGRELASTGVVVTGVLPGAFYAPGNSWERLVKQKPAVVKKFIEDNLPRKEIADAQEIIPLIMFLCSEKASMMAGSCVPIDAGEGKTYLP